MTNSSEELVTFFKALADKNRLKIVGLLAEKPYSVEELATLLGLKPPTVSHHLAKLVDVGLVRSHTESYYNVYQLDQERKDEIKQGVIDQQAETQDSIKAIQEERARRIEVMRKRSFP